VNKSQIRNKIIKIRKKNFDKNLQINLEKFISLLKIDKSNLKNIGGYYPSNYEIDDLAILDLLEKKIFKVSLPIIKKNNQMNFYSWSRNDPLKINKFGIPEPVVSSKILYPDILLVPLVAFDSNLNRLGYGGGYYDRYIEKIEKIKKVIKIGLAFSFQKISSIPINQYDKQLDFIVTEKEILK
jgi:5-formyltetrahydrofolate cyclo-ligase